MNKPEVLSSNVAFTGRMARVVVEPTQFEDGHICPYEIYEKPDAVGVLVRDNHIQGSPYGNEEYLFVEQYRAPFRENIIELMAGVVDPGETPEEAAHRELAEELGYKANMMEFLGTIYSSPGWTNEKIHLFYASNLTPTLARADPGEYITPVKLSRLSLLARIRNGKFQDPKIITAVIIARGKRYL